MPFDDIRSLKASSVINVPAEASVPAPPNPDPVVPAAGEPLLPAVSPAASKERRQAPTPIRCSVCSDKQYVLYAQGDYCRAKLCQCRPPCEVCHERGFWFERLPTGYEVVHDCPCRKFPRRLEIFNRVKIPPHFLNKDLTNLSIIRQQLPLIQVITTYAKNYPAERHGMVLVGEPGVGKTHLMVGLLKLLTLEKGVPCIFKDFFLLLREMRAAYQAQQGDANIIRPLTEVEILVIDELGKGRANSEWEVGVLDEIISTRYNTGRTTFFTTNYPISWDERRPDGRSTHFSSPPRETLEQRVGERIYSRICHMCNIYQLTGPDYRRLHKGTAFSS